jgi:hypothetical protein
MSSCVDRVGGVWTSWEPVSSGRSPLTNRRRHVTHADLFREGPLNEAAKGFGAISIKAELVKEFVLWLKVDSVGDGDGEAAS